MSYTDEDGNKCACSRNRLCGLHKAAAKKMEKIAQPMHDRQKVEAGIEDLRAKYGRGA